MQSNFLSALTCLTLIFVFNITEPCHAQSVSHDSLCEDFNTTQINPSYEFGPACTQTDQTCPTGQICYHAWELVGQSYPEGLYCCANLK